MTAVTNANTLAVKLVAMGNTAVWILVSLAVVFIVWNAVQFIMHADAEDDRKKYRGAIIWGIVGLAVIMSLWGLVNILRNTFGADNVYNQSQAEQNVNSLILTP